MVRLISYFALVGVVLIGLTGCSPVIKSEPASIMTEVSQQLASLASAKYHMTLNLKGSIPSSLGTLDQADIDLDGLIVGQVEGLPNYSVTAGISAITKEANIHMAGNVISLADFTYFQLTDLSLPSLLPVSLGVDKKWYKIDTGVNSDQDSPAIDRQLTPTELDVIKGLIAESRPFEVIEVLPITTINGIRAFHYRTQVVPSELSALLTSINEVLKTNAVLPPLDYLADYRPEIFISTRDRQLLELRTAGLYLQDNLPVSFDLVLSLVQHNQIKSISAPKSSENLDTAKLFKLPKLPF